MTIWLKNLLNLVGYHLLTAKWQITYKLGLRCILRITTFVGSWSYFLFCRIRLSKALACASADNRLLTCTIAGVDLSTFTSIGISHACRVLFLFRLRWFSMAIRFGWGSCVCLDCIIFKKSFGHAKSSSFGLIWGGQHRSGLFKFILIGFIMTSWAIKFNSRTRSICKCLCHFCICWCEVVGTHDVYITWLILLQVV